MITEKLKLWTSRRRESVTNLPVQQQAGALLMLDALGDYVIELELFEQAVQKRHDAALAEARVSQRKTGWFKLNDVVAMTGYCPTTIRRWGRQGRIKMRQPGGKRTSVQFWVEDDMLVPIGE